MVSVDATDPLLERPPTLRTLVRFLRWMIQIDARRSLASLALQFTAGLLPAGLVWIVREVFDRGLDVYEGRLPVAAMLSWLGLWAFLTIALEAIQTCSRTILLERLKLQMEDRLLEQLQRKARTLRLEVFERADFHDVLRRAQEAATPGFFLNLLFEIYLILSSSVTAVSVAIVVGLWNPILLVAIVMVSLPPPIAQTLQDRSNFFLRRQETQRSRLRHYLERVLTRRDTAKELRIFGLGATILGWWEFLYWQVADRLYRQRRLHYGISAALSGFSLIGLAAGIGWSAWAVTTGSLSAGQFAAMIIALRQVRQSVSWAVGRSGFLGKRLLNMADLFIYLDLPDETAGTEAIERLGEQPILTEDLSFRYPQSADPAITGVTFTIQPGERVAVVGANGSGKTTLVKVLLGLYRPTDGRVRYGTADSVSVDRGAVWDQSAAVFQDYTHFAFSLGENIGFGQTKRMDDLHQIETAAHKGGADTIASQLPDAYDTLLTREFSGGTELSGGEWQRVAISRGFMRNGALVVLDEPTASLDPQAEADVFRRFLAMAGGRTTIVVSHRLGSARLCDRILVLKEGRLIENGTHDELLTLDGEYARMWALQAGWYSS